MPGKANMKAPGQNMLAQLAPSTAEPPQCVFRAILFLAPFQLLWEAPHDPRLSFRS